MNPLDWPVVSRLGWTLIHSLWQGLLVVVLLFGAKNFPDLARGMVQAAREFFGSEDEDEPEIKWRRTVRSPHGATHRDAGRDYADNRGGPGHEKC